MEKKGFIFQGFPPAYIQTKSFIVRGLIGAVLYLIISNVKDVSSLVILPITDFIIDQQWIRDTSNFDKKILDVYKMIVSSNVQVVLEMGMLLPLFYKEIIEGSKKIIKNTKILFVVPIFLLINMITMFSVNILMSFIITDEIPQSLNQSTINTLASLFPGVMTLATVVVAPIVEELFFRLILIGLLTVIFSFVFEQLNIKYAVIWATLSGYLISTCWFSYIHFVSGEPLTSLVPYLVMGLLFGGVYLKTKGNIAIVIVAHILNNLLAILVS